jgi:hypothetical protein
VRNQLPAGWVGISDWCIRSKCGLWTICRYGIGDNEERWELWNGRTQLVVNLSSESEAIRAYTSHRDTQASSAMAAGAKSLQSPAGDQAELL